MEAVDIAATLREYRRVAGYNRSEAWMALKQAALTRRRPEFIVSEATIRNWEQGRNAFDMVKVLFYCDAVYGKRVSDLDADVAHQKRLREGRPNADD